MPAARAELEAKGVKFDGETFDTGVCHMANFTDPDGNPLTLHKRYAPYGDEVGSMIDVERVDYIRVPVDGHREANRFYGEVLGLRREPELARTTTGSSTRPATSRSRS